jgi:hypothetical protein
VSTTNDPNLRQATVTSLSSGSVIKFKIEAVTSEGSTFSPIVAFLIGSVPPIPSNPATGLTLVKSNQIVGLEISVADPTVPDLSNLPILGYDIAVSSENDNNFNIYSTAYSVTISENVFPGAIFAVKYRAKNSLGSGEFSEIAYVTATTVPSAPPQPILDSVDGTTISLSFAPSSTDGGLDITKYELNKIADSTSTTSAVSSYIQTSLAMSHNLDKDVDSLTVGEIYSFIIRAVNNNGNSEWSDPLSVALVDPPNAPGIPEIDESRSQDGQSAWIKWTKSTPDINGQVIGYELELDDGTDGLSPNHYRTVN